MPNVRSVYMGADQIKLVKGNGEEVILTPDDIPGGMTVAQAEAFANNWLQAQFEFSVNWHTFPSDSRIREDPPVLLPNERIEGNMLIVTEVYVAVHVVSLSPLVGNIRCSKYPISGEWWT